MFKLAEVGGRKLRTMTHSQICRRTHTTRCQRNASAVRSHQSIAQGSDFDDSPLTTTLRGASSP